MEPEVIDARYEGTIVSYKVVKTEVKNGMYYVTVKAKVDVAGDYKSKAAVKKSDVKIAVAPFSVNKADLGCATDVTAEDVSRMLVSDIIKELSATGRVQVVERYDFSAYNKEAELIAADATSKDGKKVLGNIETADYILTGSVDEITVGVTQDEIAMLKTSDDRMKVKMKISFRLIETATMEIIYTSEVVEGAIKKGGKMTCDKAVSNMMEIVPQTIVNKVVTKLYPDYKAKKISRRDFKDRFFADGVEEDEEYEDRIYQEYLDEDEGGVSRTTIRRESYRKSVGEEVVPEEKPVVLLPMDN